MSEPDYKTFYAGAIVAVKGAKQAIEEVPMTARERELLDILMNELLDLADLYVPGGRHTEIYKAFDAGYEAALEEGALDVEAAYNEGYHEGERDNQDAVDEAHSAGYAIGYNEGYEDGQREYEED